MPTLRQSIFWIHLVSGLVAGIVIAIMSITGIAIAFEEEILDWADRKVSRITAPSEATPPLSLAEIKTLARESEFNLEITRITIPRDAEAAYIAYVGRTGKYYINPYTGEIKETRGHDLHDLIHTLEEWHRWLGMGRDHYLIGKLITGICNLAFLVLCLTGCYLWWPRIWRWAVLKRSLWFAKAKSPKARNFNWHNVYGIWSLPVLAVLAATAVVISFAWGHQLVFTVFGEEAPKSRNYGMMAVPPPVVPAPPPDTPLIPYEAAVANIEKEFPDWRTISLEYPEPATAGELAAPLDLGVTVPDMMPSRAFAPVKADPYTGEILQAVRFEDRSLALQTRVWIRFIHTGAAFGLVGKIIASIATAASLVLVYTGFALSWRRFFGSRKMRTP